MSSLRKGNNENRRSVFYTSEEWELLDATPKDLEDSMALEEKRKHLPEGNKGRRGRKGEELMPFLLSCSSLWYLYLQKISENLSFLHNHIQGFLKYFKSNFGMMYLGVSSHSDRTEHTGTHFPLFQAPWTLLSLLLSRGVQNCRMKG